MLSADKVKAIARDSGFELVGIAAAAPSSDAQRYLDWVAGGMAGEMRYLTDYRAERRADPRSLLPSARSILCAGKLYNGPEPYTPGLTGAERAWISRYAWGDDYHPILREGLERDRRPPPSGLSGSRIQGLRRHRAAARAVVCARRGAGLDRQEYLPHRRTPWVLVLSR